MQVVVIVAVATAVRLCSDSVMLTVLVGKCVGVGLTLGGEGVSRFVPVPVATVVHEDVADGDSGERVRDCLRVGDREAVREASAEPVVLWDGPVAEKVCVGTRVSVCVVVADRDRKSVSDSE